jgi:hypothetical protein
VPALVSAAEGIVKALVTFPKAVPFLFQKYVNGPVPDAVVVKATLFVWQTVWSESGVAVVGVFIVKVAALDVTMPQAFVTTTE